MKHKYFYLAALFVLVVVGAMALLGVGNPVTGNALFNFGSSEDISNVQGVGNGLVGDVGVGDEIGSDKISNFFENGASQCAGNKVLSGCWREENCVGGICERCAYDINTIKVGCEGGYSQLGIVNVNGGSGGLGIGGVNVQGVGNGPVGDVGVGDEIEKGMPTSNVPTETAADIQNLVQGKECGPYGNDNCWFKTGTSTCITLSAGQGVCICTAGTLGKARYGSCKQFFLNNQDPIIVHDHVDYPLDNRFDNLTSYYESRCSQEDCGLNDCELSSLHCVTFYQEPVNPNQPKGEVITFINNSNNKTLNINLSIPMEDLYHVDNLRFYSCGKDVFNYGKDINGFCNTLAKIDKDWRGDYYYYNPPKIEDVNRGWFSGLFKKSVEENPSESGSIFGASFEEDELKEDKKKFSFFGLFKN